MLWVFLPMEENCMLAWEDWKRRMASKLVTTGRKFIQPVHLQYEILGCGKWACTLIKRWYFHCCCYYFPPYSAPWAYLWYSNYASDKRTQTSCQWSCQQPRYGNSMYKDHSKRQWILVPFLQCEIRFAISTVLWKVNVGMLVSTTVRRIGEITLSIRLRF